MARAKKSAEQNRRDKEGRDRKWQAEGYRDYYQRENARRKFVKKGDASGLKGSDAADPMALLKKAHNVQGVATVKPSTDAKGTRKLPGGRSIDAVAQRAEIQGKAIEVRYVLKSQNGIALSVKLEPGDWTYMPGQPPGVRVFIAGGMVIPDGSDFDSWVDWCGVDASERYKGMTADDVTSVSITAVDPT